MRKMLNELQKNERGVVTCVAENSPLKRRFLDIGLGDGVCVECTLVSYGEEMKAYRIKGTTIGIRKEDAMAVEIEEIGERENERM